MQSLTIENSLSPPRITLTYSRAAGFDQELYFRGCSGSICATAEVYIVVCGHEAFTASKGEYLVLDKVRAGTGVFDWAVTS